MQIFVQGQQVHTVDVPSGLTVDELKVLLSQVLWCVTLIFWHFFHSWRVFQLRNRLLRLVVSLWRMMPACRRPSRRLPLFPCPPGWLEVGVIWEMLLLFTHFGLFVFRIIMRDFLFNVQWQSHVHVCVCVWMCGDLRLKRKTLVQV